ncbi:MAG: metal-sensitive transcriptional regulator [Patescibacteria group bacterium]
MVKKNEQKHGDAHKHGLPNEKARKVINMAIGSVVKIPEMVDTGRYCPDIIQQIDSVIGLLHSARKDLLKEHLESCLIERLKTDKVGTIKELLKVYNMQ